jgi:hypothetical protein
MNEGFQFIDIREMRNVTGSTWYIAFPDNDWKYSDDIKIMYHPGIAKYEITFDGTGSYIHKHTPSVTRNMTNCEIIPFNIPDYLMDEIKKLNLKEIKSVMLALVRNF